VDQARQPGNPAVPEGQRRRAVAAMPSRGRIGTGRANTAGGRSATGRGRATRGSRAASNAAKTRCRPPARRRAAVQSASGRSATAQSRTGQGCAHRVPIRFHGALPRRAAGRRRSGAMSAGEFIAPLDFVPARRRGDCRRRSSSRRRIRWDCRRPAWGRGATGGGRPTRRGGAAYDAGAKAGSASAGRRTAIGISSGRSATAESRAGQRHSCRVPRRFQGVLSRRSAGRCRGVAMSPAECVAARAFVPECRRGDRRRRASAWRRIRGPGRRTASGSWTGGRPTGWCCADASARGDVRLAGLQCGSLPTLWRRSPRRWPHPHVPRGKRRKRVARLCRRARRRTPLASRAFSRGPRYRLSRTFR